MRFFLKIARLPEFLIFQSKLFHSDKVEGKNTCVLAYSYLFVYHKNGDKNETRDTLIIWLFSEFLFNLFSFACWRIKFLLSIFFNCNFYFIGNDK